MLSESRTLLIARPSSSGPEGRAAIIRRIKGLGPSDKRLPNRRLVHYPKNMNRRVPRGTDNNGLLLGDLPAGTRVGELVIESQLATRGTGHIYLATHPVLPRRATLHVLPAAEGPARSVALELLREACIVDAIDHPGMPRVFECGMLARRRPWIATEWIEGPTLEHVLATRLLSIQDVVAIVRDVADILAASHKRGLVHGSVAPASIVFPSEARRFPLCLVDWVGARMYDSKSPLPLVVGSPWVAPEQANAIAIEPRSDVYALGKIGRALLDRAATDEVPPLLVTLLRSMTAETREARPRSVDVLNTTAWLAAELGPPPAAEPLPDPAVRSAPITSEVAASVSGEISPTEPFAE